MQHGENAILTEGYELLLTDAYSAVKQFQAENRLVDAIITDPPYNISRENNFGTLKHPRRGLDFGSWDNTFDVCGWIEEYVKLLKDDGSIIIFCSYLYISFIAERLKNCGIDVKDVLVWEKSNPMPRNINRRYVQDKEFALWGVKRGAKWVFNKPEDKPYLRSTFRAGVVSGNERTPHPTQKSLKIMEDIIKVHTNENGVVLDPFMGSGTTGIACLKNNRKFIGIEVDAEYFEIAKKRIEHIGE